MNTCKLSLYVFWDKYGLVRNYLLFYLKELTKVSSKVIVIVNGDILSESLIQLKKIGCEVIVRDNHGLDFGAWQDALQYIGCDTLSKYDELILCNCTHHICKLILAKQPMINKNTSQILSNSFI